MNVLSTTDIGQIIRQRRKQLGVTQKDLAMACGTGLRFVVDLEKGKQTCQVGKVLQVLNALGLKLEVGALEATGREGDVS